MAEKEGEKAAPGVVGPEDEEQLLRISRTYMAACEAREKAQTGAEQVDGYYPVKVGRGAVVHLAYGHGMTVCGLGTRNMRHLVMRVDADRVTCQRCNALGARGWKPAGASE